MSRIGKGGTAVPIVAGLTSAQRRALVAVAGAHGLVLIEGQYRTGFRPGAARFGKRTIEALLNCGLLMRSSETMVKVTPDGAIEAGRSRDILSREADRALQERSDRHRHMRAEQRRREFFESRRRGHRQRYQAGAVDVQAEDLNPIWRKPYAD